MITLTITWFWGIFIGVSAIWLAVVAYIIFNKGEDYGGPAATYGIVRMFDALIRLAGAFAVTIPYIIFIIVMLLCK